MEWKNSVQICITTFILAVIICKISAFPADYDQGMREILEELERQGGLSPRMVPRAFYYYRPNPNHQMTRKSQRSSALRLRFGKRNADGYYSDDDDTTDDVSGYESSNNIIGQQQRPQLTVNGLKQGKGNSGASSVAAEV